MGRRRTAVSTRQKRNTRQEWGAGGRQYQRDKAHAQHAREAGMGRTAARRRAAVLT